MSSKLPSQTARRALEVADYAYVMELGRIVIEGEPAELLKDERVIAVYLG
jgi:ABC-type branched-subunit amino acid transport system ATPase component